MATETTEHTDPNPTPQTFFPFTTTPFRGWGREHNFRGGCGGPCLPWIPWLTRGGVEGPRIVPSVTCPEIPGRTQSLPSRPSRHSNRLPGTRPDPRGIQPCIEVRYRGRNDQVQPLDQRGHSFPRPVDLPRVSSRDRPEIDLVAWSGGVTQNTVASWVQGKERASLVASACRPSRDGPVCYIGRPPVGRVTRFQSTDNRSSR